MQADERFKEAMSRIAGVVTLITAGRNEHRCGLTATAVCSLSAAPPSIVVCINAAASAHDAIVNEGYFGVSILHHSQAWIAGRFAGQDGRKGAQRFEGSDWFEMETGAPLLSGAMVALDCSIASRIDGYSHSILIGDIQAIHLGETQDQECLLWQQRMFRRSSDIPAPGSILAHETLSANAPKILAT